jgi:hypothetical protein
MKAAFKIIVVVIVLFFFAGCKKDAVCEGVQGDWELVN